MKARALLVMIACISGQHAASQVVIPPSVEPGQVQRQLQEMRAPRAVSQQVLPPTPQQPVPQEAGDRRFILRGVEASGGTVYDAHAIDNAFAALIGREIPVSMVFKIANALTARYRRDGYILSQVLVPAQSIADGQVKLLIVEGFIANVRFRGELPQGNKLLEAYSRKLQGSRPLTAAVLERYLLLMNDLGETSASGTLVPSASTPGAADLWIDFKLSPEHAALAIDNRNSRSLGPYAATADLDWYGAFGTWDRATVKTGSSFNSKLNFAGLAYGSALGYEGAHWNLNTTYVRSKPGPAANLVATDLQTKSIASALQLDYPLLRSREQNLYLRSSLTSFDGRSEFVLADVSDDHIRAARLGLSFDRADPWRGVNMLDMEFSHGLNTLGAREQGSPASPLSRVNGRADFSKVTWYAARLQSLGGPWSSLFAVTGQQAFTTLLAPELFSFGGELFGRGYDAAEIAGDSGEAAKAELRFSGAKPQFVVPAYSLYGFLDWGEVRMRQPINVPPREVASSCGLGLRLSGERNRWQAFLEVAKPINRDVAAEGNRRPRVYFGVQVNQ